MIFDVPTLVAWVSHAMTLEPGDVLLTGTPEGVGPLAPGQTLEVEIEGLATPRRSGWSKESRRRVRTLTRLAGQRVPQDELPAEATERAGGHRRRRRRRCGGAGGAPRRGRPGRPPGSASRPFAPERGDDERPTSRAPGPPGRERRAAWYGAASGDGVGFGERRERRARGSRRGRPSASAARRRPRSGAPATGALGAGERRGDGRRVVGEVVDDRDARRGPRTSRRRFTPQEAREPRREALGREAEPRAGRERGEGVRDVVAPRERRE